MKAKYGVRTDYWKHLKWQKKFHWKAVRTLWKKIIRKED